MDTVLGVSITSTSVGWVLAYGSADDDANLDHDAFDVDVGDISQHAVAVRGAQAIAAATGHEIRSIGLTWTHDAETEARELLASLRESGYDNLVEVRLSQATKAWAQGIGRGLGYQPAAVCVVEPAAVTLLTVDARGAVQIDVTQSRDSANPDGLSRWLSDVLNGDRRESDSLLLIGSRSDRDELTERIDEALPMPVICTAEAQLVLARGAALALANKAVEPVVEDDEDPGGDEQPPPGPSWISSHTRLISTIATAGLVVVAIPPSTAPPPPPPPVQAMVAELPPPQAPIPTEVPESLTVVVPQVELVEEVPESPPLEEHAAVVHEPHVAVLPGPIAAEQVAPEPEALHEPPPPPPAPVQSVLSPVFGGLP